MNFLVIWITGYMITNMALCLAWTLAGSPTEDIPVLRQMTITGILLWPIYLFTLIKAIITQEP
jgi:hypothetical protein